MTTNVLSGSALTRVFVRDTVNRIIGLGLLFLMLFRLGHALGLVGWTAALFIDAGPGILIGLVASRWHWRWPLLLSLQTLVGVRVFGLGLMAFVHNPWALAGAYLVTSMASHLGAPIRSTWISLIVDPTQYESVSGLLESTVAIASVVGPSLASLGWSFVGWRDLMFILMALSLMGMMMVWNLPNPRVEARPRVAAGTADRTPQWLGRVLLVALLGSMAGGILTVLLIPLITIIVHMPLASAGYVDSLMGGGAIVGSMVVIAAHHHLVNRAALLPALGIGAVFMAVLPLAPNFYVIAMAMAVIGVVEGMVMGIVPSLFMRLPKESRMRGFAHLQLVSYGGLSLGAISALATRWIGLRSTMLIAACLFGLSAVVFPALPKAACENEAPRDKDVPSP